MKLSKNVIITLVICVAILISFSVGMIFRCSLFGHKCDDNVVEATCTTEGYTEHKCSYCDYTYKDNYTSKTEHIYEKETTASCVQAGKSVYTCVNCGYSYSEIQKAAGHTWVGDKCAVCNEPKSLKMDNNLINDILSGKQSFVDFGSKKEVTISSLPKINSDYSGTAGRYAICDLDANGVNELIVEYNMMGDTAIINLKNNILTAYYISYRGISDLKADGTMSWSSGANVSGVSRISFVGSGMVTKNIIEADYLTQKYIVNGAMVSESECNDALSKQYSKQSVKYNNL